MPFFTVAAAFDADPEMRAFCPVEYWVDHRTLDEAGQHELARELLAAGAHRVHFVEIPEPEPLP